MQTSLRPFQKEALDALKNPAHVVCIAATGSGKSLIYEYAAKFQARRTILISPLVALQYQQKIRLTEIGLIAFKTEASRGSEFYESTRESSPQVWILSPESLENPKISRRLELWKPDFLVVDEAHTLFEWGESFRPSLKKIPSILALKTIQRSLWLSATISHAESKEFQKILSHFSPLPIIILGGFRLPENLEVRVKRLHVSQRGFHLALWLRSQSGKAGIVFVQTREQSERIARLVNSQGIQAHYFHAGISREEKSAIDGRFREGSIKVIVATSAFGLGLDYSQVAWVLLWQAPTSLSTLAQQIGRAGRGHQKGEAEIWWSPSDFEALYGFACRSERDRVQLSDLRRFLEFEDDTHRLKWLHEHWGAFVKPGEIKNSA